MHSWLAGEITVLLMCLIITILCCHGYNPHINLQGKALCEGVAGMGRTLGTTQLVMNNENGQKLCYSKILFFIINTDQFISSISF